MSKSKKKKNKKPSAVNKNSIGEKLKNMPAEQRNKLIIISCISLVAIIILTVILVSALIGSKTDRMGTGACEYLESRDVTGRDVKYVEMCVEDYGRLVIMLDATTAPITVNNFISLVEDGFYDGLTFHRIIEDFMVQGGDPSADGTGGSKNTIKGEFDDNGHKNDISHKYGVISMARSSSNSAINNYGYDSASSQFFICNADSDFLDGQYAAFGYVVEGMSVIDEITSVICQKHGSGVLNDKADQPVIKYIKVLDSWEK